MTALTGRTVSKWVNFSVEDASAMRDIPFNALSVCGVTYEEHTDLVAFQDAVKGALPGMPDAPIEIGGPWDTTAAVTAAASGAAPALTGSHTVLSVINGGSDPKALDIKFGVRAHWETGAPQFGITPTAASGYLCVVYTVDVSTMLYSARFVLFPGSALPAWGTAIEVVL